jgi:autotransporter-associated beta strand protein
MKIQGNPAALAMGWLSRVLHNFTADFPRVGHEAPLYISSTRKPKSNEDPKRETPHMKHLRCLVLAFSLLAGVLQVSTARAQNGTWINPGGGSWANSANWQGGIIAQGTDSTADFGTLSLSADATVTLDGAQTIGNLIFADKANAHNWILNTGTGGPLTLSVSVNPSPIITVSNRTATIGLDLVGTQGLSHNGNGMLVLIQPVGYDEGTTNNAGTIDLSSSLNTTNNPAFASPLVINAGVVESAATLNLDVNQNNEAGSTNVLGDGTLRLVATNNGPSSPDLFFAPDAFENDYYGAALDASNLDLGDSQRYIFALTEHNAVAQYDPWEDARIDANIMGAGGITYIAQNTYGGGEPKECPLVLAGSNTFTGEVEIQRGSIYLFNTEALAQTNELLMDPAVSNNARLFLYGSGATVANLESSGAGNALIANGNVLNPIAIAPATLTVDQTSNTIFGGVIFDAYDEYDEGQPFASGPLSLVKNGPGTLTLSGANAYSGSNAIDGGELVISTQQTGGGPFSVANGAALGISGIYASTVAMSDLALGTGANTTVEFTFNGPPVSFIAPVTTASLEANGGANSVTLNIYLNGTGIPAGQFPLIQYTDGSIGGSGAGFSAFHLGILPPSVAASLVNDTANNSIDLKVTTGTAAPSQNGTWINPGGGSWANSADWQGGNIAQGIGFTANFSTLSLTGDATVTLDGALTIGNLIFGDQANAHNWFLNTGLSGPLTLRANGSAPSITVSNQTATIGLTLAGTGGLNHNGNGTLVLVQPAGYTGGTTNNAGTLELLGSLSTYSNAPLAINSGIVESAATLNLDVDQNNDSGSTNVIGAGLLRLVGTTNSSSSPDLYFDPDAFENYYYGAAIDSSNLDLGASQRYIFAITEHNAVAQYDPWENARIDANIIGAGGITYIAQNTYGGDEPMECPLVLAGSNTFTGEVEIRRGSIYLFNPSALVETNELLMDPAGTNNARLFLYGNGATVANLTSSGTGNPLIANGNVGNPITIAPATLTVVETSSTGFGGVLVDGQYEYDVVGGALPGPLSLVKTGPGTLTLTGTNGYSGSTSVNQGELVISASQTNDSAFSLADDAALGIAGISASNGVTMSDLALGTGGNNTLEFTFSGTPELDIPAITTASLEANGGTNSVTINIHLGAGVRLMGQYSLIQFPSQSPGGSGAGFSAFHLGTLPNGLTATLVGTAHSIDLQVTGEVIPPQIESIQVLTNGVFSMSIAGTAGTEFTVRATTNLALTQLSAWTVVGTGTLGSGVTTFDDLTSTNYPDRFYLISVP